MHPTIDRLKIVTVRPDLLGDLHPLFEAYRSFYKQESAGQRSWHFLQERLVRRQSIVFIAYFDENPVGFTQLFPSFSSVSLEPLWILNDLYVVPEVRGQRVGEALIDKAAEYSRLTGGKGLILETAADNHPAQRLYERVGFVLDTAKHYFLRTPREAGGPSLYPVQGELPRLRIPIYRINAFTDNPFGGNPAAVCPLPNWLDPVLMQQIAAENNLSETAFMVEQEGGFGLRWFTPTHEVDLCGHATLAAAHAVFTHIHPEWNEVRFQTRSGELTVTRQGVSLTMNLPAYALTPVADPPTDLVEGLGARPVAVLHALKNYYAVFESEEQVRALRPDFERLARLHPNGVSVTAPGQTADFVSRYFAPSYGIDEDPVSGHPHCALTPYWADRLGMVSLKAEQVSARGGVLLCELLEGRVALSGRAVQFSQGDLCV